MTVKVEVTIDFLERLVEDLMFCKDDNTRRCIDKLNNQIRKAKYYLDKNN